MVAPNLARANMREWVVRPYFKSPRGNLEFAQIATLFFQRVEVAQSLSGMLVTAIAGVDDGNLRIIRNELAAPSQDGVSQ